MKMPEISSKSEERSFQVASGALRVTDPCYNMDAWCAGTLENVKNGTWFASVGYNIDKFDLEMIRRCHEHQIDELQAKIDCVPAEVRKVVEAHFLPEIQKLKSEDPTEGYVGRVAYIAIRHESVNVIDLPAPADYFLESNINVGVDSGQAGFFDLAPFKAQAETEDGKGGYKQDTEHGKFYRSICDQTCDTEERFAIVPFGAASSSGYGDGGYNLYTHRNEDGQVVAAIIGFIEEYSEEEEVEE